MITFGKITVETLPEVREIGEAFTKSVNYPGGFSYEAFRTTWEAALQYDLGAIFCARDEGRVVGLFGANFITDPFSGKFTASEAFWFVVPEARNSSIALRLFRMFEDESKLRGCQRSLMIHLHGEFSEALRGFYERRGYAVIETIYGKQL